MKSEPDMHTHMHLLFCILTVLPSVSPVSVAGLAAANATAAAAAAAVFVLLAAGAGAPVCCCSLEGDCSDPHAGATHW